MENSTGKNTRRSNRETNGYNGQTALDDIAHKYTHIIGWGIDADPNNEPTYPMKNYTGADHDRLSYERPPLQPETVEVLHSNERPNLSAVFGTVSPPSGLSGAIRRFAFKYSEESLRHWFALVLADRVNVAEGIVDDLKQNNGPNIFAEMGWRAKWKHNKKDFVKKVAIAAAVGAVLVMLLKSKSADSEKA